MRRPAEFFDDKEISLVHIAGTLRSALKLEDLLTESGIDYAVETDTYKSGFLFWTQKVGAFFYVATTDADRSRELLRRNRYRVHHE